MFHVKHPAIEEAGTMTTLAELMARDNVRAIWTPTHEISTGPHTEYEMWDLLLIRNSIEPTRWVTGGDTRRTAYIPGIGGCQADSRRATGGERRHPDTLDTLDTLLSNAAERDEYPTFRDWSIHHHDMGDRTPAWQRLATYEELTSHRDTLRAWLPDAYNEYLNADRD